jgi:hypothetical protein
MLANNLKQDFNGCLATRRGKLEHNERTLIDFLKKLFGERVLANNLMLVVTHMSRTPGFLRMLERQQSSVDAILESYSQGVQRAFGLRQNMIAIDIDTGVVIACGL